MSKTKKYNKKSGTKKNNKKSRTFRKKTLSGGQDNFVKKLRERTRTRTNRYSTPEGRIIKRTINPNGPIRFNRSGRSYVAPTWEENGYITDNNFGPSQEGLYAGPSIKYGTMGAAIPHGKDGKILYTTGDVYTGDFVKGKREGTGKLTIKEGPTYEGDWKDDKFVEFTDWKNANKNNSKTVL